MIELVDTPEKLQAFRAGAGAERVLALLHQHGGRGLVAWAVGVGKSVNLDAVVARAAGEGLYDLVVVFCPTRQVIAERRWVADPPLEQRTVILEPRPRKRCGPLRNAEWEDLEQRNLGLLGRQEICNSCPRRRSCPWPQQYGEQLQGAAVIFCTQSHLERDPAFLYNLQRWTGAKRILTILDEDKIIMASAAREIRRPQLEQYAAVLKALLPEYPRLGRRLRMCQALLAQQHTPDLRAPDWRFTALKSRWRIVVQQRGNAMFPGQFVDIGYALHAFGRAAWDSRELRRDGTIGFAMPPRIPTDLLVYSGTAIPEFLAFRLGGPIAHLFAHVRFAHAGTAWYNLASRCGAARHFLHNAPQVLDFFAGLVAQRARAGRRVLLVSKKCFASFCAREMAARLKALGIPGARVVTGNWARHDLADPAIFPLITYGIIGTNLFEHFDAVYCLNSFYVSAAVIDASVQDMVAADHQVPLEITMTGLPLRRSVTIGDPRRHHFDLPHLANSALRLHEMDTVIQAVGRVRPFTRPREVITFQAADHPQVTYTREFLFLDEARQHFGVLTRRATARQRNHDRIQQARAGDPGATQASIAQRLGVSLRTVKRRWAQGDTKPQ